MSAEDREEQRIGPRRDGRLVFSADGGVADKGRDTSTRKKRRQANAYPSETEVAGGRRRVRRTPFNPGSTDRQASAGRRNGYSRTRDYRVNLDLCRRAVRSEHSPDVVQSNRRNEYEPRSLDRGSSPRTRVQYPRRRRVRTNPGCPRVPHRPDYAPVASSNVGGRAISALVLLVLLSSLAFSLDTASAVEIVPEQGISFSPGCRCGNAPLDLSVSLDMNGRFPITVLFGWGDGTDEEFVTTERALTRSHVYATAGNFTLVIELTDDSAAFRREVFSVHVFAPPYAGTVNYTVSVNGRGNGSTFQVPLTTDTDDRPWVHSIFIRNTGDVVINPEAGGVLEVVWNTNQFSPASPSCFVGDDRFMGTVSMIPGAYRWVGFVPRFRAPTLGTFEIGDTVEECVSVFFPNRVTPTMNVTIEWTSVISSTPDLPTIAATLSPSSIATPVGVPRAYDLTVTNTGNVEARVFGELVGVDPSISVIPTDPGGWGTWNGTYQTQQGDQRLVLFPDESVSIPVSVDGTRAVQDTLAFRLEPCRYENRETCGLIGVDQVGPIVTVTAAVSITGEAGAVIATLTADVLSTTRVDLSGKVISLANSPFVDVFFQIRASDTLDWLRFPATSIRVSAANTVVTRTVALDPNTDYQFEFVGQAASGQLFFGGVVTFRTEVTDEAVSDFGAILGVLEQVSGFKAEVWGLFFGGLVLIGAVWVMNSLVGRTSGRRVPWTVQLLVVVAVVIINAFLFLWHVGIVLTVAILAGALWVLVLRRQSGATAI